MDTPAPLAPIEYNESNQIDNNLKIIKKEYKIKKNEKIYNLIISKDNEYIYFKIYKLNELISIYYKNKFDLKNIINILNLSTHLYDNLDKVIELIDECYKNKKILINEEKDNKMYLIIKYMIGFKEHEFLIVLKKEELDINEKFEIIFN